MTAIKVGTTEVWDIDGMRLSNVHAAGTCQGEYCVLHNPSDHKMRDWKLHAGYVAQYMMMYRVCEHGSWHNDPDALVFVEMMIEDTLVEYFSVSNRFDVEPPYAAIHVVSSGGHLNPVTREGVQRA